MNEGFSELDTNESVSMIEIRSSTLCIVITIPVTFETTV